MWRLLFVLMCLYFPLCTGCATERQYFFNHNPISDAAIAVGQSVGGFFETIDNSDLTDVEYSANEPAEIRPL